MVEQLADQHCGERHHDAGEQCAGKFSAGGMHSRSPFKRIYPIDRKSTRLNSSHLVISYAVFCLKKKHVVISRSCFETRRIRAVNQDDRRVPIRIPTLVRIKSHNTDAEYPVTAMLSHSTARSVTT